MRNIKAALVYFWIYTAGEARRTIHRNIVHDFSVWLIFTDHRWWCLCNSSCTKSARQQILVQHANVREQPDTVIPALMDGNYIHNRIYIETLERNQLNLNPFFIPMLNSLCRMVLCIWMGRWSLIQFHIPNNSIKYKSIRKFIVPLQSQSNK